MSSNKVSAPFPDILMPILHGLLGAQGSKVHQEFSTNIFYPLGASVLVILKSTDVFPCFLQTQVKVIEYSGFIAVYLFWH